MPYPKQAGLTTPRSPVSHCPNKRWLGIRRGHLCRTVSSLVDRLPAVLQRDSGAGHALRCRKRSVEDQFRVRVI